MELRPDFHENPERFQPEKLQDISLGRMTAQNKCENIIRLALYETKLDSPHCGLIFYSIKWTKDLV